MSNENLKKLNGHNRLIDVRGQQFGVLTVIDRSKETYRAPNGRTEGKWILQCECGEKVSRTRQALGRSKTCGGWECRRKWTTKIWEEKKGFSLKGEKVTSWHRLQKELKHLRIENAKLKLEIEMRGA